MRQRDAVRAIPMLLLVLLLAACGGGSDEDTPADSAARSTNAGGAGAAAAASTSAPSDAAQGTGGSVSPASDIAPLPDPSGFAGVRGILDAEFEDGERIPFLVEALPNGTVTEVGGGIYSITPAAGATQTMLPTSIPRLNDGIIETVVSLDGEGAAGVSIRSVKDAQGTYSGYVCWISRPDGAACSLVKKDQYQVLFQAAPGSVQLAESNTIRVAMIGNKLHFEVNGQVIGTASDTTTVTGNWGLYAESGAGGVATAAFDSVRIYRAPNDFPV